MSKFEAGDKVCVRPEVDFPEYGWGEVDHGEIGLVRRVEDDGVIYVDFPSQEDWMADECDIELAEKPAVDHRVSGEIPEKKSRSKAFTMYAVVTADNEFIDSTTSRDDAREVKAAFGGKKAGVRIIVMQEVKEIR